MCPNWMSVVNQQGTNRMECSIIQLIGNIAPKTCLAQNLNFGKGSSRFLGFQTNEDFFFLHHSNSYQHDFVLFNILVVGQETHRFQFLLGIGLHTKILTHIKSTFHNRIDNTLEIRRSFWTIKQNRQVPIGILAIIASYTGAIKQQMGIWRKTPFA